MEARGSERGRCRCPCLRGRVRGREEAEVAYEEREERSLCRE